MPELTYELFIKKLNSKFSIESLELELSEVSRSGAIPPEGLKQAFSLLFTSSAPHQLQQGTYSLYSSDFEQPLFLVPISANTLEAVFN